MVVGVDLGCSRLLGLCTILFSIADVSAYNNGLARTPPMVGGFESGCGLSFPSASFFFLFFPHMALPAPSLFLLLPKLTSMQ